VNIFQQIKDVALEVMSDLTSCKNRALMLKDRASNKHLLIFISVTLVMLGIIIFKSSSQAEFYLNFLKLLSILLLSFLVYCQSDCFWFIKNKAYIYDFNIKNKDHADVLLERAKNADSLDEEINIQEQLIFTVSIYSEVYKIHATRYLIEIIILLFILFFINPLFFFYNLALFGVMFAYDALYERGSAVQAFADIIFIINCIKRLNNENPKKCKEFITKNKHQEIRDLTKLYHIVLANQ
jgi:hypothetical protein